MPRRTRLEQERAMLAHRAHLPLLRGMARAFDQLLPPGLGYLIITFDTAKGMPGGYVSNGQRKAIAQALKQTGKRMPA